MSEFAGKVGFGVLLILFGLRLFFKPKWYAVFRETYMDFTDGHRVWGVLWMLVGVAFLSLVVHQKIKNKKIGRRNGTGGNGDITK